MKEESSDEFQDLRKTLVERLENTWKDLDEDVLEIIDEILHQHGKKKYLPIAQRESLRNALFMSVRRMDILEELLENDDVTEIMINGWNKIFIEKDGKIEAFEKSFSSPEKLEDVIQQMASKCNRVINTLQPIVDARLAGGERINAVIAPVALDGPVLTIRKFPEKPITMERLLKLESITEDAAIFLEKLMKAGYTILIGGGTGSGTTFLNALSEYIPKDERVITIEDNAELQIQGIENLVRLECRPANIEKSQEITIGDLLRTCLRMRPSRIIVGEVRGKEAAELLQVVNIGNDGSLSTIHANSCQDMISRLETMVLMGIDLPIPVIRRQIVSGFDIFIHLGRMSDKSRKVLEICEIKEISKEGEVVLNPLFVRNRNLEKRGQLYHTEKLTKAGIIL